MPKITPETIIVVSALLTAIVTISTKAKTILLEVKKMVNYLRDRILLPSKVMKFMELQSIAIEEIKRELTPNGGLSIKDAIDDIRRRTVEADIRSRVVREAMTTGMYECSPSGECVWVNEALCDLFGMHPNDMMGHGWLTAIRESDRERARIEWENSIKNDSPYSSSYSVINQKTGEEINCWTKASKYSDSNGKIVMYYGTVKKKEDKRLTN